MPRKAIARIRVNLFMSERLHARVDAQARESGISIPEFCRRAIENAATEAEAAEARRIRNSKARTQ